MAGLIGVIIVALPGVESGVLEGAGKAEGDRPGERTVLSDGGKVVGGLLDGLAAGEEDDAGEGLGDVAF